MGSGEYGVDIPGAAHIGVRLLAPPVEGKLQQGWEGLDAIASTCSCRAPTSSAASSTLREWAPERGR
jgi:hypothetical protein